MSTCTTEGHLRTSIPILRFMRTCENMKMHLLILRMERTHPVFLKYQNAASIPLKYDLVNNYRSRNFSKSLLHCIATSYIYICIITSEPASRWILFLVLKKMKWNQLPLHSLTPTMWKHSKKSVSQEEGFQQTLNPLAPWSGTSQPLELWEINICCLTTFGEPHIICGILL